MNKWHVDYTKDSYEQQWKEIRRRILKRDRYRCRVLACNIKGAKNLTVHHIVPRDEGGGDHDANLITLCSKHHDEIEIERVRVVALIEAWEDITSTGEGQGNMTRTILAIADQQDARIDEQSVKNTVNHAIKTKRPSRHQCANSTVEALDTLLTSTTLAEATKHLGYSPQFASTISAIMHRRPGAISAQREDELREKLGLPSIALVQIKRSDRMPIVDAPVKVSKRKPPVRKTPKQKQGRNPEQIEVASKTERIAALPDVSLVIEEPEYNEDYVILGEDNEWEYVPRSDTTIGVRVRDASWFDTLAMMTNQSKADMFSEMLLFYMNAHHIELVECSEKEYEAFRLCYSLGLDPEKILEAALVEVTAQRWSDGG